MKTNEKKCVDCKFFEPSDKGDQGFCRRLPPALTITLLPQPGQIAGQMKLMRREDSGWPLVKVNAWCGEWQPMLTPLVVDEKATSEVPVNNME